MKTQTNLSSLSNSCIERCPIFSLDNAPSKSLSFDKTLTSWPCDLRNKENFAKLLKVLKEKFERAKSCCFRGCKFCKTIYSNFSEAKAIYGKSFGGEIFNAPGIKDLNFDNGTNSICNSILSNISLNSNLESFDLFSISDELRIISEDKCSGAIKFIIPVKSFHSNSSKVFPLLISAEINTFESGINIIYIEDKDSLYFFANDLLTFLPISTASSSVNTDLSRIKCSLAHSDILSLTKALITLDQSIPRISSIFCFKSSDISIINSPILKESNKEYKKVSNLEKFEKVRLNPVEALRK